MWTVRQKIRSFHLLSLEIQSIFESHAQTDHTRFWPCPPKLFLSTFNWWEFVSTLKMRLFYLFFLEIWLIKKSCNLIGWKYFHPNLRNTANNINYLHKLSSVKINYQIFKLFIKPCFWPIFGQNLFYIKSSFVMQNFTWVSSAMPKFRKN